MKKRRMHWKRNAALLLDMGLGKTAICLSAMTPDHLPVLVTAPPRPVESVWPVETKKWRPDLTCRVAAGRTAEETLSDPTADIVDGEVISSEDDAHKDTP